MSELPIVNDITALGLVALVLMLGYYFLNKLFQILTDHLERMVDRQERTIVLLESCLQQKQPIQDPLQNMGED